MRKLAVLFPGIGYTLDRPLLHFSRRIAEAQGYAVRTLPYTGFPAQVRNDREKLIRCYEIARAQTAEMLADLDLSDWSEILFVGKSIGTVAAAELADRSPVRERIRQVIFTPLEDTFSVPIRDAIVFTGGDDPWVGGAESRIPALCGELGLPCQVIPGANHSLETGDVQTDIAVLRQVMEETEQYIRRHGMVIRPALASDLEDIAALHCSNQKETYRGLLSDEYLDRLDPADGYRKWDAFLRCDGQALFAACDETGLLGFAACRKDPELPDSMYLESLHVTPGARGKGTGTALIRRAGRFARESGCRRMSVCIVKGNDTARRLYVQMGAVHLKDFIDHFEGTTSHSEKLQWPDLRFAD